MEPGNRNNIDVVLQISVSANRELYKAIKGGKAMAVVSIEIPDEMIEFAIPSN